MNELHLRKLSPEIHILFSNIKVLPILALLGNMSSKRQQSSLPLKESIKEAVSGELTNFIVEGDLGHASGWAVATPLWRMTHDCM